jgi:hypothetical protein
MISRKELMEWLNTCPDHHWDIVHEDEGHMRVLFVFDEEQEEDEDQSSGTRCDGKLVLSDAEKNQLIHHYKTEAWPDWVANWLPKDVDPFTGLYHSDSEHEGEYEEMHWSGIQFEEDGRMFDICMHFVDGKQWAEVYECYRMGDNWNTSTQKVWLMHEELEHDNA